VYGNSLDEPLPEDSSGYQAVTEEVEPLAVLYVPYSLDSGALNPAPKTRNSTGAAHQSGGGRGLNPNPETLYPKPKTNPPKGDTEEEGAEEEVAARAEGVAASERRGNSLKGYLRAKASIWPWLSYMCHIRSTAVC